MTTSSPTNSAWTIGSVLSESWRKVAGFKATYVIAMIIYMAVALAAELVMGLLFGWDYAESASGDALTGAVILEIVISIAMIPLGVGLGLISVRRAAGKPVNPTLIFEPYQHALPIIVMMIMMSFDYRRLLTIHYSRHLPLGCLLLCPLFDHRENMGAWQSLEESA